MYNTTDTTTSKPSRLKNILFAIVFMAIGGGITGIASGYYWNAKYNDSYRNGQMDQRAEDTKKAQLQQDEESHRLAERILNSPSN